MAMNERGTYQEALDVFRKGAGPLLDRLDIHLEGQRMPVAPLQEARKRSRPKKKSAAEWERRGRFTGEPRNN